MKRKFEKNAELSIILYLNNFNLKRAAWNMLISIFNYKHILSFILNTIGDVVLLIPNVFDNDLLARRLRPVNANHKHAAASIARVHCKLSFLISKRLLYARALDSYFGRVRMHRFLYRLQMSGRR